MQINVLFPLELQIRSSLSNCRFMPFIHQYIYNSMSIYLCIYLYIDVVLHTNILQTITYTYTNQSDPSDAFFIKYTYLDKKKFKSNHSSTNFPNCLY